MLEKWKISPDNGGDGGGVLKDLSKTFDNLDCDLFIAKRFAYGFDKNALLLIKSYHSDRRQRMKRNLSYSSWFDLLVGIPQGSILEPLIFNLYINDLFLVFQQTFVITPMILAPYTTVENLMAKLECTAKNASSGFILME